MKRSLLALAVLAAAACGDGGSTGTGPSSGVESVVIATESASIEAGATLQLSASALTASGSAAGAAIAWSSLEPAVADVSGTGLVTARAAGTARIVAAASGRADTARITVGGACSDASVLRLEVGQSYEAAAGVGTLCVDGGAAGSEYVVVPQFATATPTASLSLTLTAQGIVPAAALRASRAPAAATMQLGDPDGALHRDEAWEAGFRARASRELAGRVTGSRRGERPRFDVAAAVAAPAVGDAMRINVSQSACGTLDYRNGRVVAVSDRAVVVADVANPAGGLTDAEYRDFAAAFDTLVYPVDVANFGTPTDIDGNGRAVIFYTKAVNELTEPGSTGYVGGFFFSRDLFPRTTGGGLSGCAGSNVAEIFYMLVPDPDGTVNGNRRSRELILNGSVATLAHEFQHLINASRRLHILDATNWDEDAWLNEGLSHIAEELLFYRVSGLAPGQNLDVATIRAVEARRVAFNRYMNQNYGRFDLYLEGPDLASPYDVYGGDDNDLATRGAAWMFLRYAADRKGGDQSALWRTMVDADATGMATVQRALAADPRPWVRDWTVANFADDAVAGAEARHLHRSWNLRTFYAGQSPAQPYPLRTDALAAAPLTRTLAAGGSIFGRFGVAAGTRATLVATSAGAAPPATVRMTVLRTR